MQISDATTDSIRGWNISVDIRDPDFRHYNGKIKSAKLVRFELHIELECDDRETKPSTCNLPLNSFDIYTDTGQYNRFNRLYLSSDDPFEFIIIDKPN